MPHLFLLLCENLSMQTQDSYRYIFLIYINIEIILNSKKVIMKSIQTKANILLIYINIKFFSNLRKISDKSNWLEANDLLVFTNLHIKILVYGFRPDYASYFEFI